MKTKHTSGPWYPVGYACYTLIQSGPDYTDTDILNSDECDEAEANANLIAAAPELLEALKRAQEVLDKQLGTYNYMGFIESTIHKATS